MASPSDMLTESPAGTTDVDVKWCGMNHLVDVKADGNIGDLKRRTYELMGLPSKRQRHMDPNEYNVEFSDDYPIGRLQQPRMTDLISLNSEVEPSIYKGHFYVDKPKCTVKPTNDHIDDFDGSRTGFYNVTYQVGSMVLRCLMKYYKVEERADLLRSIELMRTWKHQNLVVMENLYTTKRRPVPRLVLSNTVSGSFLGYIKSKKVDNIDLISNANGTFTSFFRKMIIDLCAVLDKMVKRKLCPRKLTVENLYLKSMDNADPELKILFDNVDRLDKSCGIQLLPILCTGIKDLCADIKALCTSHGSVAKDVGTEAFCNFLGKEANNFIGKNLAETAMHYPINWTNEQKSKYLIDLIPSSKVVWESINACGISWPKNEDGDMCEELQALTQLVETENDNIRKQKQDFEKEKQYWEEEKEKIKDDESREAELVMIQGKLTEIKQAAEKVRPEIIWNYRLDVPHDLVRLTRNLWKHFDTYPSSIKEHFVSKDKTLEALERWCPNAWFLLYNAIGLV